MTTYLRVILIIALIVLGPERRVEVYRQPENGSYRESLQFGADDTLQCASVPAVRIRVSALFA